MLEILYAAALKILFYLLILLVGLWYWSQWAYRDLIRAASKVPVVFKHLPILGHAHYTMFGMARFTQYTIDMVANAVAQGIYTFSFWCGPLPIIVLNGVEDIQKVLNSSITSEKGYEIEYLKFALGNSILTASGDIWRIKRRYMNYLFHSRNLEQMGPLFNKSGRDLVSLLSEHVGRGPVDVMDYSMDVALKTVCHIVFGYDVNINVKSKSFQNMKAAIEKLGTLPPLRIGRFWLRSDTIFNFLYKKEIKEINNSWKHFTEETLKDVNAKSQFERQKSSFQVENAVNGNTGSLAEGPIDLQDVYSVLIKHHPQYTEKDLWFDIMALCATGTDTVAISTSSCLLALAQHQDIQERLYKEIVAVTGPDDDVNQEDFIRMPYLDQVIKETLRYFFLVPFVGRRTTDDLELSACTVPKGNTVMCAIVGIHLDPRFYPNPKKFDPNRFSSANIEGNKKYSFLPFSGGPRNCIGVPRDCSQAARTVMEQLIDNEELRYYSLLFSPSNKKHFLVLGLKSIVLGRTYSTLLMKTILVHFLRRYKVTTTMDINSMKQKMAIALVSTEGYHISVKDRSCSKHFPSN